MAKRSMTLHSFFSSKSDVSMQEAGPLEEDEFLIEEEGFSVPEVAPAPVLSELDKIKNSMELLSLELLPMINKKSSQQVEGIFEKYKRLAVYEYFLFRLGGSNKTMASAMAAQKYWCEKATHYRINMIIKYPKEYRETRNITPSAQDKHSKRVSVLDDNNIKRKVIEWFQSVLRSQRSIPALQNHLKNVILPDAVDLCELRDKHDTNNVATNPLFSECIRRKLIQWGFDFKCLSK